MRVLITGASGELGAALARAHMAEGDHVVALRHVRPLPPELRGNVEELVGDIETAGERPWPRTDVVYHCAALMADQEHQPYRAFHRVNVVGTAHVLSAARKAGASRIVYVSSVGVLGPTHGAARESQAYGRHLTKYERSKMEAEGVAYTAIREGIPVTMVRPAQLYGPGLRHLWPRLIRQIQQGRAPILGAGSGQVHLTHVDDVVRGMRLAATVSGAVGRTYHLAAAAPVTMRHMIESIASCLGAPPPPTVPYGLVDFAARLMGWAPMWARPGSLRMLTIHNVQFFVQDRIYSIEQAQTELGYQPRCTWDETIASTVAWYRREAVQPDALGAVRPVRSLG